MSSRVRLAAHVALSSWTVGCTFSGPASLVGDSATAGLDTGDTSGASAALVGDSGDSGAVGDSGDSGDSGDTGIDWRFEWVELDVTVAPGAILRGELGRVAGTQPWGTPPPPSLTGTSVIDCYYAWTVEEVTPLQFASTCPNCDFAFEVEMTTREDVLPRLRPGTVSSCPGTFPGRSGLADPLPTRRLYYSHAYHTLYDELPNGVLVPYLDVTEAPQPGRGGRLLASEFVVLEPVP